MYFFAYFPFLAFEKGSDEFLGASRSIVAIFCSYLGVFPYFTHNSTEKLNLNGKLCALRERT